MSVLSEKARLLLLEIFGEKVKIFPEYVIGENLRIDFYLPDLNIAVECDGRQHEVFVEHFHKTAQGFRDSQKRDTRKEELCLRGKIPLVRFSNEEDVNRDEFFKRHKDAVSSVHEFLNLVVDTHKDLSTTKSDLVLKRKEERLELARKYRKESYQWMKQNLKK